MPGQTHLWNELLILCVEWHVKLWSLIDYNDWCISNGVRCCFSLEYRLVAFISHMGTSTKCGHYVCHILRGDQWVIFNDEKVALSEHPPKDLAYIYLYQRLQWWINVPSLYLCSDGIWFLYAQFTIVRCSSLLYVENYFAAVVFNCFCFLGFFVYIKVHITCAKLSHFMSVPCSFIVYIQPSNV